tara:strand:+ start:4983 stop:5480 length:498 start_codon:yes stop_codon:yes gene_type:complete
MDTEDFRSLVLAPSLKIVNMWSLSSEILMLGTALTESNLHYLKQHPGPALGVCQMEHLTYLWACKYIARHPRMRNAIVAACHAEVMLPFEAMAYNLRFAVLMARVKYWAIPSELPKPDNITGLCNYYLRHYNTNLGKATFEKAIIHFDKAASVVKQGYQDEVRAR